LLKVFCEGQCADKINERINYRYIDEHIDSVKNKSHKQNNRNRFRADNINGDYSVYNGRAEKRPIEANKSETEDNDTDCQEKIGHHYILP
jgi:hypothetical protein